MNDEEINVVFDIMWYSSMGCDQQQCPLFSLCWSSLFSLSVSSKVQKLQTVQCLQKYSGFLQNISVIRASFKVASSEVCLRKFCMNQQLSSFVSKILLNMSICEFSKFIHMYIRTCIMNMPIPFQHQESANFTYMRFASNIVHPTLIL